MPNYFKMFALPECFAINFDQLDANYYKLIAASHPDSISAGKSTFTAEQINIGYKALQDDYSRLRHLLETTKGFKDDIKITDPEFLMQFLDYQDQIESDEAIKLKHLHNKLQSEMEQLFKQISTMRDAGKIDDASNMFAKLKFYTRIINQINEKQEAINEAL